MQDIFGGWSRLFAGGDGDSMANFAESCSLCFTKTKEEYTERNRE